MTPKLKTVETIKFKVRVLKDDIENGKCGLPSQCMEKIAIERALRARDPGIDHRVKIDGGSITFNLDGHKWLAHTPKLAKRSLIRFDGEMKRREKAKHCNEAWQSKVEPHEYVIEATKLHPIAPVTKNDRARLDQINAARAKREAKTGTPDKKRYTLRYRVEGMHTGV